MSIYNLSSKNFYFFCRLPGALCYRGPPPVRSRGSRPDLPQLPLLREPLPHGHPRVASHCVPVLCKLPARSHPRILFRGLLSPETLRIQ